MRTNGFFIPVLLMAASSVSLADPPENFPRTRYSQLWSNSIVTDKPVITGPEKPPETHPLDDYSLGGWTKTSGGYVVSLFNPKEADKRITISPTQIIAPKEVIPAGTVVKVIDVRKDPKSFRTGEVLVQVGTQQKWIGFEEKLVATLQQPAVKQSVQQPNPNQPQQNAQQTPTPTQSNNNQSNRERPSRVRRVPTPPTR